ncbi:MAG: glycosyltransferase family 9 protein [Leptospirales bacterium]
MRRKSLLPFHRLSSTVWPRMTRASSHSVPDLPNNGQILVVLLGRIGDVVLTLPSVIAIKKARPDLSIDWVVEDRCSDLLRGHPSLRSVILFRRAEFERNWKEKNRRKAVRILLELVQTVRRPRYDAVLDFQGLLKSGVIAALSRSPLKLGSPSTYGKMKEGAGLFSRQVPLTQPDLHLVDRHGLVVRALLGEGVFSRDFFIPVSESERNRVYALLSEKGWSINPEKKVPEKLILIHPFASWPTRQWPVSHFADVVRHFLEQGHLVGIIGGGGAAQKEWVRPITDLIEQTNLVKNGIKERLAFFLGETSLRESAFLMTLSELVITDDSGPMHLCAALGVRTLAVFGPTDPVRLGPSYGPQCSSIHLDLACQPCMKRRCPIGTLCLEELHPDMVTLEALRLLTLPDKKNDRNGLIGAFE